MSETYEKPRAPNALRRIRQRFDYDLNSEFVLLTAAIWLPHYIGGELLPAGIFSDEGTGGMFEKAMEINAAGGVPQRDLRKAYPKRSWFWCDPEMNGFQVLIHLWTHYCDITQKDVKDAIKAVRDSAVRRAL